jgi:hypothetical protein
MRLVTYATTLALLPTIALPQGAVPAHAETILWAWERPEALTALPAGFRVAAVMGFLRLRGDALSARGRRFPLLLPPGAAPPIAVVHIEIDQTLPLLWSENLRARVVETALGYAAGFAAVQIDMEVRASQRAALLAVLGGVRAGLPPSVTLSMTAFASWCENEDWIDQAPVDEIVPMLFRLGAEGFRYRDKFAAGEDFANPRCRAALGISMDAPIDIPAGRRTYVFNPRSWTGADLMALQNKVAR